MHGSSTEPECPAAYRAFPDSLAASQPQPLRLRCWPPMLPDQSLTYVRRTPWDDGRLGAERSTGTRQRGEKGRAWGGHRGARAQQTMAERQIPARLQGGRGVRFLSAAVAEGEDERKRQGTRGRVGAFSGKGGCMGGRWARGVQRAARRDTGRQGGRGGRCWVSCREAGMHRPARIVHSKVGVGIKTWGRYGQAQGWH